MLQAFDFGPKLKRQMRNLICICLAVLKAHISHPEDAEIAAYGWGMVFFIGFHSLL